MMMYDEYYPFIQRASKLANDQLQAGIISAKHPGNYKFVREPLHHYKRIRRFLSRNPIKYGSRVFDIGAGTGIMLYLLKHSNGCETEGLDLPNPLFQTARKPLNLKVYDEEIIRNQPMKSLNGFYDYITVVLSGFDFEWSKEEHGFWFEDAISHLAPRGKLYTTWNIPVNDFFNHPDIRWEGPTSFSFQIG